MILGIDASNIRRGGGVTHLFELLSAEVHKKHGFVRVVVWGGAQTLAALPERPWLEKVNPAALNRGLHRRIWWQRFSLVRAANVAGCNVLFVPGGSYAGSFSPTVTMSQNLLPFEWQELRRYGWSLMTLKLHMLRYVQSFSFQRADGVIFLTEYGKQAVQKVTGELAAKTATIAHGFNPRFQMPPREQRPISEYTKSNPCRILYVSIVDQYKHQWYLVEAVHALRAEGLPVVLELVGPAYPSALARLQEAIERFGPEENWVHYRGPVPYEALHSIYTQADIGVFASSCETFGIILLEAMAAGLPVASSNRSAMPEVLGDTGLYFDPENPSDITQTLRKFINSPVLRGEKARASFMRCQQYSWGRCADETFSFLAEVARGSY